MARTLKSGAIPDACKLALCVDTDNTTIIDAYGSALTNAGAAVGGSATWRAGTSTETVYPVVFDTDMITLTTAPIWPINDETNGMSVFVAGTAWTSLTGNACILGSDIGSAYYLGVQEYTDKPRLVLNTADVIASSAIPTSGAWSIAVTQKDNEGASSVKFYKGVPADATMSTDGTGDGLNVGAGDFAAKYIGNYTALTRYTKGSIFLLAMFNRVLTPTELNTLHADPFGTLFTTGEAPVVPSLGMLMGVGR